MENMEKPAAVPLEKLQQALSQPNNAIRKRALAIIFNEARVEAAPILEEYLGRETEPDLQALGFKVLKKLQEFKNLAGSVPTERLLELLQCNDLESRLLALRGLIDKRSSRIAQLVATNCTKETDPEALVLVSDILRRNPTPQTLPSLFHLAENPNEKVRQNVLEGFLNIIFGCLYPNVLKSLLDPSQQIKMRAYHLISNVSRANLLETLEFMLSAEEAPTRHLAGKLLPSFLAPDLLPILEKNIEHPDPETKAFCKRAVFILAQKGNFQASQLLEKASGKAPRAETPETVSGSVQAETKEFQFAEGFPDFLCHPLREPLPSEGPASVINVLREVFRRVHELLGRAFICSYFSLGSRNPFMDRTCFRTIQQGIGKVDLANFLRVLSPALPDPDDPVDFFPLVLGSRLQNDFNDHFLDHIGSLQTKLRTLEEAPDGHANLLNPILLEMGNLFQTLGPLLKNRLVVKSTDSQTMRVLDHMAPSPKPVDPRLLVNFEIPLNSPVLINGNSGKSLSLFPFLKFDQEKRGIVKNDPDEHDLWEYLSAHNILDSFMNFLREKST